MFIEHILLEYPNEKPIMITAKGLEMVRTSIKTL